MLGNYDTTLTIRYLGRNQDRDCSSDFLVEGWKFAQYGSISSRQAHRFKDVSKMDIVRINPWQQHPGWRKGKIKRFGGIQNFKSGQVEVAYVDDNKLHTQWIHLDNKHEISEVIRPQESQVNGNSSTSNQAGHTDELAQLKQMGYTNEFTNVAILNLTEGDIQQAIDILKGCSDT